ncbi:MAG: hypothetical protein WAL30_01430 [Candidatus Aquirickettsiella sp.]
MMNKIEIMWCQYNSACWQKNQETHWVREQDTSWLTHSETTWVHSQPINNDNHFYNSLLFYPASI